MNRPLSTPFLDSIARARKGQPTYNPLERRLARELQRRRIVDAVSKPNAN